jgi:excisionase family DNA binding protein
MSSDLLTTAQIAEQLNVSQARVRDWCRSGKLKAEFFGKTYVVKRSNLAKFRPPHRGWPAGKKRKSPSRAAE